MVDITTYRHRVTLEILPYEISAKAISLYGIKWEVQGSLTGPNGQILYVVTVWITLETSGETRFVTLFPDKERHG